MYQVFISYRRIGGFETAKHLYDLLRIDGYTISFDIDTLREGDFDTQLLSRIEECEDFILIVDPHCFDRTLDPKFNPNNDWLRQELAHALKLNKNILPVLLAGASFPDGLPDDIKQISKKHGPKYDIEYFDSFYAKLKGFIHSVPARKSEETPHSSKMESRVSLYTKVPCRVEESGHVLAEVRPGFEGSVITLGKGRHRLLFVSTNDERDRYTLDYKVEEGDVNDIIDIDLEKVEASRIEKEEADKQRAEKLYEQAFKYDAANEEERAFRCYLDAAKLNHVISQFNVGFRYEYGEGVKRDFVEAARWYRLAAEQGHDYAQFYLGACYEYGKGVIKDYVEAVKWYRMAAEQGNEDAIERLKELGQV